MLPRAEISFWSLLQVGPKAFAQHPVEAVTFTGKKYGHSSFYNKTGEFDVPLLLMHFSNESLWSERCVHAGPCIACQYFKDFKGEFIIAGIQQL